MKYRLVDLYNSFFESIMIDCALPAKTGKLPVNIVENMFNIENDPYLVFLIPGFSLS